MEEIDVSVATNVDETTWMISNFVSHEVTVENQSISEAKINTENSIQNPIPTQGVEVCENDKVTGNEQQNTVTTSENAAFLSNDREDKKEMHSFERPNLAEISSQNLTPTEESDMQNKEEFKAKESANIKTTNVDTTLVINNEHTKVTNTSYKIPSVLFRTVQKVFPIEQIQDRNVYPQTANINTPTEINPTYNVPMSLRQISLRNIPAAVVPASQNPNPTEGAAGVKRERDRESIELANLDMIYANYNPPINNILYGSQYSPVGNSNHKIGLLNNGSTCYINSVMQVLLSTNKFSTFTVMKMHSYPYWSKLAELFGNMMYTVCSAVDPKKLYMQLNSAQFDIFQEHDASEFLIYLFELLKKFEPNWENVLMSRDHYARPSTSTIEPDGAVAGCSSDNQTSDEIPHKRQKIVGYNRSRKYYIDNLFGGVVTTMVKCLKCNFVSKKYEMVHNLHLSFPDVLVYEEQTIQMLLNYYFTTEMLTGENSYMCDTCQDRCDAMKTCIISHNPKYLILTLKNFRYDAEARQITKTILKVHCDETIYLHSYTNQVDRCTYKLYALIVHRGKFLYTGHYIALTKFKNQWFHCSDNMVSEIDASHINSLKSDETPYMLFYRRTDVEEGDFPPFDQIPWMSQYVNYRMNDSQKMYFF